MIFISHHYKIQSKVAIILLFLCLASLSCFQKTANINSTRYYSEKKKMEAGTWVAIISVLVAMLIAALGWLGGSRGKVDAGRCDEKMNRMHGRVNECLPMSYKGDHDILCAANLKPMRQDIQEIKENHKELKKDMSDGFKMVVENQQANVAIITAALKSSG